MDFHINEWATWAVVLKALWWFFRWPLLCVLLISFGASLDHYDDNPKVIFGAISLIVLLLISNNVWL